MRDIRQGRIRHARPREGRANLERAALQRIGATRVAGGSTNALPGGRSGMAHAGRFTMTSKSGITVQPNLSKVNAVREARIRYYLFEQRFPQEAARFAHVPAAIVESGVVLLSASLQSYFEAVFLGCASLVFGTTSAGSQEFRKTWSRWGNPSSENVKRLFQRLAIPDVFEGLVVSNDNISDLVKALNNINQVRNRIAHGDAITVDGQPFNLNLSILTRWTKQMERMGPAFSLHARNLTRAGAGS